MWRFTLNIFSCNVRLCHRFDKNLSYYLIVLCSLSLTNLQDDRNQTQQKDSLHDFNLVEQEKVWQWWAPRHVQLWDPVDWSPPSFSVYGIPQARILEWGVFPFSRGSSQPTDQTGVSNIAGRFFTIWATREALVEQTSLQITNTQNDLNHLRVFSY